ncbi:unnamed protein product [Rangifer tarandus platyrhynchus]|uniref:Uncharacterized protein n=1 Tax=Rangifer tarandus platyrhynchus TaxID=3082113 RepID=A0AC59ZJJ1_RANTA
MESRPCRPASSRNCRRDTGGPSRSRLSEEGPPPGSAGGKPGRPAPPHKPSQPSPATGLVPLQRHPKPSPRLTPAPRPSRVSPCRKLALLRLLLEAATALPLFPAPETPPLTLYVAQKPEAAARFCACASGRPCLLASLSKSDANFRLSSAQPAPSLVLRRWRTRPCDQWSKDCCLGFPPGAASCRSRGF